MGGKSGEALQRAKIQTRKYRALRARKKLEESRETKAPPTPEEVRAKENELRKMYRDKYSPGSELAPLSSLTPLPPSSSDTRLYFCRPCKKYQQFSRIQPNIWKCPGCPNTTYRR